MVFHADHPVGDAGEGSGNRNILLVEDSRLFSSVLSHRFHVELGLNVVHCASMHAAGVAIDAAETPFTMAVVDLNLPDSPYGEILDLTIDRQIPTIVFTGTFNMETRDRIMARRVVDYVVKDNDLALDNVVAAVRRALSNRSTRVLVVDDVLSVRRALVDILESQQFCVVEASTGKEALVLLEQHPDIELVLTDYHMPDMDGYELTRRIRRKFPSDRMRIIGISSSTDRLLSASFLKAGASDFVYRPYVVEELQCRIAHNVETLSQLKQLRIAAACDYLTGLYNRRYFYDEGPKAIDHCLRNSLPSCAAVADIDHFKRLNDTYGHEIGDKVLIAVANKLKTMVAGGRHLLSRLGGEEFGILLTHMDANAATAFCNELCGAVSTLKVAADEEEISVTISIGVAEVRGYETFENYLNAADQFLYMAKHKGRNQVYSDHRMAEEAGV